VKARIALLALMLATVFAHAEGIPHTAMVKLHMDIMREYPTVGQSANYVRQLCTMTADHAQFVMGLRATGLSLEDQNQRADDGLVAGTLNARNVRFSRAVAAYVYALPPLDAATIRYDTLKNCLLALEN